MSSLLRACPCLLIIVDSILNVVYLSMHFTYACSLRRSSLRQGAARGFAALTPASLALAQVSELRSLLLVMYLQTQAP